MWPLLFPLLLGSPTREESAMALDVVHERCCGLDVHKRTVVACVIAPDGREVRTFGTMTADLEALAGWLEERRVTHVAMESTGVVRREVAIG
jgi:transposase